MKESEERRLKSDSNVLLNAQLMKESESKRLLYNELIAALKVFFSLNIPFLNYVSQNKGFFYFKFTFIVELFDSIFVLILYFFQYNMNSL